MVGRTSTTSTASLILNLWDGDGPDPLSKSSWEAHANPRTKVIWIMCACVTLRLPVTVAVMGKSFDRWSQIYLPPIFLLLAVCSTLRNNRRLMQAFFIASTIYYICVDIAIIQIQHHMEPFIDPLDLKHHPESLLAVTLEIVTIAPVFVLILATMGNSMRLTIVLCGCLSLGAIITVGIVMSSIADHDSVVTIILFLCGLYTVAIYVVLTREEFRLQVLHDHVVNLEQARAEASNHIAELEHAKQQRHMIVSYLFHEVRNPINNVMLALNLVQSNLAKLHSTPRALTASGSSMSSQTTETSLTDIRFAPRGESEQNMTSTTATPPPSHNFTPLNFVAALREVEELVETVNRSAMEACNVLNDALTAQKLDAGTFEFVRDKIHLGQFYGHIRRVCSHKMASTGVQTEFCMDPALEGLTVLGDDLRLRQVIENFLSNAFKFTPSNGVIKVVVQENGPRVVGVSGALEHVVIRTAVIDSGIGIPPEDMDKVFKLWSQIRAGATQQGKGSGLGLAICKDIVEKGHGGQVGVISAPNKGSEFYFEINFSVVGAEAEVLTRDSTLAEDVMQSHTLAPQHPTQHTTHTNQRNSPAYTLTPSLSPSPSLSEPFSNNNSPMLLRHTPTEPIRGLATSTHNNTPSPASSPVQAHIPSNNNNNNAGGGGEQGEGEGGAVELLVVEDSDVTRKLMARTLDSLGVRYHMAINGKDAIDHVTQHGPYKMILMDKEMPVMDGYEATLELRRCGYDKPIIGVTGNGMGDQVEEFVSMGANEVIVKPIRSGALSTVMLKYNVAQAT